MTGAPFEAVSAAFPAAERPWLAGYPAAIDWAAEIPVAPLNRLLDDAVARFPERPCIDFLDRTFTYREIGGLVDRAAKGLAGLGVRPGAKVGMFLPNCPYFVVPADAALKAGGTVVNYNPLYAERGSPARSRIPTPRSWSRSTSPRLYDKLAAAAGQTRLRRIVVCRMADILPFAQLAVLPLCTGRSAPRRDDRWVDFRTLSPMTAFSRPSPSTRRRRSRCCSTPAAPPGCPRRRC
jgi:long-chain acyl-CoA synthetase